MSTNGEALVTDLEPVGETTEVSWSETAPVASNLFYAVTAEVGGLEVLWLLRWITPLVLMLLKPPIR